VWRCGLVETGWRYNPVTDICESSNKSSCFIKSETFCTKWIAINCVVTSEWIRTDVVSEQSPSWEANSCSASQEMRPILWNPKLLYRVHQSQLNGSRPWRTILFLSLSLKLWTHKQYSLQYMCMLWLIGLYVLNITCLNLLLLRLLWTLQSTMNLGLCYDCSPLFPIVWLPFPNSNAYCLQIMGRKDEE
jgi:hypothetical protein